MADLTCNGAPVVEARILLPRVGTWVADLVVDTDDVLSGAVTLAAPGPFTFRGTVTRAAEPIGRAAVRVVGGAGRLGDDAPPLFYRGVPLRLPLGDVLRAVGESLSTASQAAVLDRLLDKWTRERGPAATALGHLLDAVGGVWRVLTDGTVWVGEESWPEVDVPHDLVAEHASEARVTVATEVLEPDLRPGVIFRGGRVSVVEHHVAPDRVRTVLWYEREGAATDRAKGALEAFVRRTMRATLFHARFPARVVAQDGTDNTLSLRPDADDLPDLAGVPIRTPVPGAVVKVANGARVLVGFAEGDPRKPFAALWESGTLNELAIPAATRIDLGNNPTRGAARLNDDVTVSSAWATWFAAVGTGSGAGAPPAGAIGAVSSASTKTRIE